MLRKRFMKKVKSRQTVPPPPKRVQLDNPCLKDLVNYQNNFTKFILFSFMYYVNVYKTIHSVET